MVGRLVAKVVTRCRAEADDLYAALSRVGRRPDLRLGDARTISVLRSGQARTGCIDAGGHQACLASVFASFLLEVGCGADKQGAAVGSAEHAGEHASAGLDFLGDLAAAAHPDDPAAEAVGYPQRPVRVQ